MSPPQQLDVVFPSNDALQATFVTLETSYVKANIELSRLVAQAGTFVRSLELQSDLTMLSVEQHEDDVWCLDSRGLLTLHLSKESYQTLGITGQKLPFKHRDGHNVSIALQPSADSLRNRQKRDTALAAWDLRRKEAGRLPWTVLYSTTDARKTVQFATDNGHADLVRPVKCEVNSRENVRVPTVSLPTRPSSTDAAEDWDSDMSDLFEWIGMACLDAQRLQANDRVNPYVAVYDPPEPSRVTELIHLRWRGFLNPDFVQSVVNAASTAAASPQFVSITCHAFPTAPVSFIRLGKDGKPVSNSPPRVPRADGEDTFSVILAKDGDKTRWCLAESIGTLDKRWG